MGATSSYDDGVVQLSSDGDLQVKKGAQLLDRLLKDIATEDASFSVDSFVLLLKDRLYVSMAQIFFRDLLREQDFLLAITPSGN